MFARIPSLLITLFSVLTAVALVAIMAGPQVDPDAWWHLRVADWMISHHELPSTDVISWWSGGTAWISPSWLNECLLWLANLFGGTTGMSLLYVPVFALIVLLTERIIAVIEPKLAIWQRMLVLAPTMLVLGPFIAPRAANWDLLFALFAVLGWLHWRQGRMRLLWLMPIAGMAWANLHGGGTMVYVLLAAGFGLGSWLDRAAWPRLDWNTWLGAVVLTCAAFAFNGYGFELYAYPWATVFSQVQSNTIREWLSPDLARPYFLPLRVLLSIGLLGGLARARQNDAAGALMAGGMLFLGLGSARYLLLALPLMAAWYLPAVARGLRDYIFSGLGRHSQEEKNLSPWVIAVLSGALALCMSLAGLVSVMDLLPERQAELLATQYPTSTLDELATCPGRVWTDYGWGGWVSYQAEREVGPYGAADSLGDERLAASYGIEHLTLDPSETFDSLEVDVVLTERNGPLAHWLEADPKWIVKATDDVSLLAARVGRGCAGPDNPANIAGDNAPDGLP